MKLSINKSSYLSHIAASDMAASVKTARFGFEGTRPGSHYCLTGRIIEKGKL